MGTGFTTKLNQTGTIVSTFARLHIVDVATPFRVCPHEGHIYTTRADVDEYRRSESRE